MTAFSGKRGGGKRSTEAAIEGRRAKVVEGVAEGLRQSDLVEELGVSRSTIWRDLEALRTRYSDEADASFADYRKKQLEVLEMIEQAIVNGLILPDVANAWRNVRADISKLLGLDAPTKHLTARVDAGGTALQYRFLERAHGLSEGQIEEVFKMMDAMPRGSRPTLEAAFKEASDVD
jgi:hypothetical protein